MKKKLLLLSAIAIATVSSAQLDGTTGYTYDATSASSLCFLNLAPGNGGVMTDANSTFVKQDYLLSSSGPLTLVSQSDLTGLSDAIWFALPTVVGVAPNDQCSKLYTESLGFDMTSNSKMQITWESDVVGAELEIFIGGGAEWYPSTSTYNTGGPAGQETIIASVTADAANVSQSNPVDFNAIDATVWGAWAGKNNIEAIGFRSKTADATFKISKVNLGSAFSDVSTNEVVVNALNVYPNPASDELNVVFDANSASSVELTDLTGKVVSVQTSKIGANTISFDVANVNAGVYFVTIKNAAGNTAKKVIIK